MSQRARIAIIALAAVGLVLAFFAARGSEDSDDPPAPQAQTQAGPADDGGATAPEDAAPATTETTPPPPAEPEIPVIRVVDGKPRGGVQDLDFEEGDRIRFRVRSDVVDHVHVHGYDVMKDVGPGRTATFSFDGKLTGRFEIELEDRGVEIASLRVSP